MLQLVSASAFTLQVTHASVHVRPLACLFVNAHILYSREVKIDIRLK